MAATDQTYRSQRTLDIVFGISSLLMLISIVLLFAQDYFQPWKTEQRTFRDVDEGITQQQMLDEAKTALKDVDDAEAKAYEAREILDAVKSKDPRKEAQTAFDNADKKRAGIKADYDSKVSLRNIAIDHRDNAKSAGDKTQEAHFQREIDSLNSEVNKLKGELDKAEKTVEEADQELKRANEDIKVKATYKIGKEKKEAEKTLKQAQKDVSDAETELKEKTGKLDTLAKAVAKKRWKVGDFVRRLPIIDGFASPLKINQITLEGYPIDYSFKRVTRYDRCTTCHLGIDQEKFDHASLAALKDNSNQKDLLKKLRAHYDLREDHGEKLGFDPSDLPKDVVHVALTEGRIRQFAAHPRLDLFLDAKSPHPIEKFGCTSCHAGQGSGTSFFNASHVPNNPIEKERWVKEHDWEMTHAGDWEYPMLPHRFVESSCLKCHHQVTDTISYGSREEAPKLLRGYNLIKDFGCYGCHEIAGFKQGQEIGPDLRLELSPPIETLPPAERERLLADKTNPPGNLRKVGPSLYRIGEKTSVDWVARWVRDPRGFRPDTKMPHFYGLSNNDKSALPDKQQAFPDIEIQAIAHYIMEESKQYLSNKDGDYHDIYHRLYQDRKKELEAKDSRTRKEDQELTDIKDRLNPDKQKDKSPALQLQESPHTVKDQIIDGKGNVVDPKDIPVPDKGRLGEGGRLFRERGCLACHSHDATAKKEEDDKGEVRAVISESNFGPNLSRIKAKLAPGGNDPQKRRWLIQWILNPNVHHPRTRMPITHLTPAQAARIADWLLSRDAKDLDDWKTVEAVGDIKTDDLRELVRVFLAKAPGGITRRKVDDVLTAKGNDGIAGFSDKDVLLWSADERRLVARGDGGVSRDDMLWYVGRKAINRYGCFACHDIPGFETAKPIGTPLNEWGKKDPERLAFEDSVAYVKEHYKTTSRLREDNGEIVKGTGDKDIYEQYYLEALEHHQRDGFLHQKLSEPRSFDFDRDLPWDERLRMPQFKFARTAAKLKGEDPVRAQVEEAEARETVMTFVLGLVAEPVPSAYMPHPDTDRQAEIKGRQVLDKFNCASCHMIRAGVYDFKLDPDAREKLGEMFTRAKSQIDKGYPEFFKDHNAWVGRPQARIDRLRVFAIDYREEEGLISLMPTQAIHIGNGQDIPAGVAIELPAGALIRSGSAAPRPFGGDFGDLLLGRYSGISEEKPRPYLTEHPNLAKEAGEDEKRAILPPPLHREGEKVQPSWLQRFLRDPKPIRPPGRFAGETEGRMLLRMPKFNMSDDEVDSLVRYFLAVDTLENPGASTANAWLPPPQLNEDLWRKKNADYLKTLADAKTFDKRRDDKDLEASLRAFIQFRLIPEIPRQLQEKEAQVKTQEEGIKTAPDKTAAEARLRELKAERDKLEKRVKELKDHPDTATDQETKEALVQLKDEWPNQAYATDGYHLLAQASATSTCLQCHQVGNLLPAERRGPVLYFHKEQMLANLGPPAANQPDREAYITSERLRPEFTLRWISQPGRLHGYSTPMVPFFDRSLEGGKFQDKPSTVQAELFEGTQVSRITALRDVLMNTPPVAGLPGNRYYRYKIGEQK